MSAAECSYLPLCERDLAGEPLGPDDEARLEQHLAGGCAACERTLEAGLEDSAATQATRELEARLAGAVDWGGDAMDRSRALLLTRIQAQIADDDAGTRRRSRRRMLRILFYVINLVAVVLLTTAYVALQVAFRVERRAAERLATETELQAMASALARYVQDTRQLPQDLPALLGALDTERPGSTSPYYPLAPARLTAEGEYLDDFGHAYRYVVRGGRATLYSIGPNRRDEEGRGDDLPRHVVFTR